MNPAWAHWLVKRGKEFIWSAPQLRTIDPPRLVTWRIAPLRTIYNSGGTHLPPCGRRSTVPRLSDTAEHLALFHQYIISPMITREQCSKRCVWPCRCHSYHFQTKIKDEIEVQTQFVDTVYIRFSVKSGLQNYRKAPVVTVWPYANASIGDYLNCVRSHRLGRLVRDILKHSAGHGAIPSTPRWSSLARYKGRTLSRTPPKIMSS